MCLHDGASVSDHRAVLTTSFAAVTAVGFFWICIGAVVGLMLLHELWEERMAILTFLALGLAALAFLAAIAGLAWLGVQLGWLESS